MADLIDRQMALDLIKNSQPEIYISDYKMPLIDKAYIQTELMLVPTAQQELKWIPCSERLPEEDGQYLITVKYKHVNGYESIYAEHGDWFDGGWDMYYCSGHCGEVEDIIAWMPLPKPYKGETDG